MANYPILTFIHIAMGCAALLAGAGAMIFRKGSRRHRLSGSLFCGSMLAMSALGAWLALTFYLVATAWMTVRRRDIWALPSSSPRDRSSSDSRMCSRNRCARSPCGPCRCCWSSD